MIYQVGYNTTSFFGLMVILGPSVLAIWSKFSAVLFLFIRPSGLGLMDPPPYYYYATWIYSISVEFDLTSHLLRQEEMFGPVTASGIFKAVVEADAAVVDAVTSVDIVNVTLSDDVSISPNG